MGNNLPPVLFLHGWGGSGNGTFDASGLSTRFRNAGREVLVINLPGHGAGASADPSSYSDLAGEIVDTLPSEPVDVIGYSLGAKLTLAIAAQDRALFRRIVLCGVGDNIFAPEVTGETIARFLDGSESNEPPEPIAALIGYAMANGNEPAAMAAVLRRPPNPIVKVEQLPRGSNLMLVNSIADGIAMPDARLKGAIPDAKYVSISDVDHLSLPHDPRFCREAFCFLQHP